MKLLIAVLVQYLNPLLVVELDNSLLNNSTSKLIVSQIVNLVQYALVKLLDALWIATLENQLDHIVAKHVLHQAS